MPVVHAVAGSASTIFRWRASLGLWAVAVLAAVLAVRGLPGAEPAFTDAARHVMNGALIHDMIRDGGYTDPIRYARTYYTRAPALSLPYHPPVFPVMEAAAFAVFGVRYDVARILTALTAAASVLLFGQLVLRTHASAAVATLSAAALILLPFSQWVAHEVMLEFPSLIFIAGACLALVRAVSTGGFTNSTAFWYAAMTILAFWTKQHAIFIPAVAFVYIGLSRQWRLLRDWRLWAASLAVGASIVAYTLLVRLASAGSPTVWKYKPLHQVILHHADFYVYAITARLGWTVALAPVFAIVVYAVRGLRGGGMQREALYAAWVGCYTAFILVVTPWDLRYLFYLAPAMAVLVFSAVEHVARPLGARRVWAVVCGLGIALAAWTSPRHPDRLEGFYAAARTVADMQAQRVLICSMRNGAFITGMRTIQPHFQSIVIRGDAFPNEFFSAAELRTFLHEYGIDAVVVDDTPAAEPWDVFRTAAIPALELRRTVRVVAQNLPAGEILVIAHTNPSRTPRNSLRLGSTMVGGGIDVELK